MQRAAIAFASLRSYHARVETFKTVEAYIASHPARVRSLLQAMRRTIRAAAPHAEEKMSYGIPTYKQRRNLVHFGAFEHHIGFYPTSSGIRQFAKELSAYETSKGTVRFPLTEPLPLALVGKITRFRVGEEEARSGVPH